MPVVLRSQTVYLSITVTLVFCRFLCLSITLLLLSHVPCFVWLSITLLLLSHVPCFVSAPRCSCSLMCFALSQHHAALALSCALLCLSITQLLLSHVLCFVSASRCSCSLMCLALSQHHAALALSCALLVSASRCSCSLMCFACLSITLLLLSHVLCLSQHHAAHVPCFVLETMPSCHSSVLCLVQAT